jgi:hypothetical protein
VKKIRDMDLMQLADGELEAAARPDVEAAIATDAGARARLDGVAEIGELVRTHLELAADDDRVARRLGAMWSEIDKRIDLDREAPAERVVRPEASPGLWGRFTRWLDSYRGHILTGTLSAGAVAAIVLLIRPGAETAAPKNDTIAEAPTKDAGAPIKDPDVVAVADPVQPVEVEELDVEGGSGTVITVEDEDGEETTVVWLTDETVEGI